MKRIISMAVVLVITMAATAQKGELAMNENISGKDHISKNEKEATPVGKKPKAVFIFDVYGEIPTTKQCLKRNIIWGVTLPENGILSSRIIRMSMM